MGVGDGRSSAGLGSRGARNAGAVTAAVAAAVASAGGRVRAGSDVVFHAALRTMCSLSAR